jgi:hypothetical protein
MGLVLPMILVVPHHDLGSLTIGLWRVEGVLLAIAASILVGLVWAALFPFPPLPVANVPQTPSTAK